MLAAIIILFVIATDQITKYFAITLLAPIKSFPIIEGVFELYYVRNRGAAWGMLADNRWIFMTISTISIICMIVYLCFTKNRHPLFTLSMSLIIGGGIGNMIDRIFYEGGAVVDFFYFKLIDFPVFNIADSAVSIGAVLLITYLIFFELKTSSKKDEPNDKTDM